MNPYTVSAYLRAHPDPAPVFEIPDWTERALCAETDPEAFFPEKGGSTREAKRVCRSCEVRAECLRYALEHDDAGRFGIWGGLSERERRRLRYQFGRDIAAAVASVIPPAPQSLESAA
jgi:WhiB family redox-sensing transcriptional regulator